MNWNLLSVLLFSILISISDSKFMNLDLVDAIVVVVGVGVGVEVEVEIEIDSVFLFPSSGFLIMIFPKPRKYFLD